MNKVIYLYIGVVLLNILDVVTTAIGLSRGLVEINPFVHGSLWNLINMKLLVFYPLTGMIYLFNKKGIKSHQDLLAKLLFMIGLFYWYVVVSNIIELSITVIP